MENVTEQDGRITCADTHQNRQKEFNIGFTQSVSDRSDGPL